MIKNIKIDGIELEEVSCRKLSNALVQYRKENLGVEGIVQAQNKGNKIGKRLDNQRIG